MEDERNLPPRYSYGGATYLGRFGEWDLWHDQSLNNGNPDVGALGDGQGRWAEVANIKNVRNCPEVLEAYRRAVEAGLIPQET